MRLQDTEHVEYGVLRRTESGHITWATMYETLEAARDNATPLDSVEKRIVGPWQAT